MTQQNDWWRTAVIYQVYPRSFADSNGDGIGDLPGITSRLGALKDLGVDAVWLSPFMTSPQKDAGYDVADYCDVDPLFGTLADFDDMRDTAHSLGLKVIIDLVPNHSSSAHRWFQEALAALLGKDAPNLSPHATARVRVSLPASPRATRVMLVDRATGKGQELSWPPDRDGPVSAPAAVPPTAAQTPPPK